jgi:hypothetical protein
MTETRVKYPKYRIRYKSGLRVMFKISIILLVYCRHELQNFFLIRLFGGGVQLGPLGTPATIWPIVPAPGDYEDGEFGGMMIDKENRSTRRKYAPELICPPQIHMN